MALGVAVMEKEKRSVFDKLEAFYLSAMRKALLVFSTMFFVYATVVGVSSLYQVTRSADDVVEANSDVQATEIIPVQSSASSVTQSAGTTAAIEAAATQKSPFEEHASRMYAVWTSKFEVHRKASDPTLSESEFTGWYAGAWNNFNKPEWCSGEDCTDAEFEVFKSDLALAETTVSAAAVDSSLVIRMAASSSGQANGYDNVFVDVNRNFWAKLTEKRKANQEAAEVKRAEIAAGKVAGSIGLTTAGWAFAAFISLMFAFLLVAVERHQRKMAGDIEQIKANLKDD